jgi:flagellum-specific ATP synthase
VQGLLIESLGPQAVVGELCQIEIPKGRGTVWAEVVGLRDKYVQLMPFDDVEGIEVGCEVVALGESLSVPVSEKLLGRVLDGMGRPIDGEGDIGSTKRYTVFRQPPSAMDRKPITESITTGIRSIDGLTPLGKGQRVGIFAGSGVGKSTLLGMVARNTDADINVVALIGERGREVREFMEHDLGPEGLKKSILIVSTSNTPPLARLRGAYVATAIAEYFRDQGKNVMLLFDSVTRFANAQREIGLAIGEPPATRGYPPSVFSLMPKLLERSGTNQKGSITGIYTILVDGDDMDEPVSDNARGVLDGHIVLSRRLAEQNHYPAVDVLKSVSRLAPKISDANHQRVMGEIRRHMALYAEAEDIIAAGAYVSGSNQALDHAIAKRPELSAILRQAITEKSDWDQTMLKIFNYLGLTYPAEGDEPQEQETPKVKPRRTYL